MNPVSCILIVSVITLVILNVFACFRVMQSEQLTIEQKTLQCILIWLIPFLGAGLCIALTREPKRGRFYGKYPSEQTLVSDNIDALSIGEGSGDYFHD